MADRQTDVRGYQAYLLPFYTIGFLSEVRWHMNVRNKPGGRSTPGPNSHHNMLVGCTVAAVPPEHWAQ